MDKSLGLRYSKILNWLLNHGEDQIKLCSVDLAASIHYFNQSNQPYNKYWGGFRAYAIQGVVSI